MLGACLDGYLCNYTESSKPKGAFEAFSQANKSSSSLPLCPLWPGTQAKSGLF